MPEILTYVFFFIMKHKQTQEVELLNFIEKTKTSKSLHLPFVANPNILILRRKKPLFNPFNPHKKVCYNKYLQKNRDQLHLVCCNKYLPE